MSRVMAFGKGLGILLESDWAKVEVYMRVG